MIGILKKKMELERNRQEEKKRKEGFLCDQVVDLLNKHVFLTKSSNENLFSHTEKFDTLSMEINDKFE